MAHILIVGGSDAGISAGLRARQIDPSVETTVVTADAYPNYSICGIPYHISGDVPDWRDLAHRTRQDLKRAGLRLLLDTRARHIDPTSRTVTATRPDGRDADLRYDRLIIGTGAVPVRPPIAGLHELGPADGVHLLHTMTDTLSLAETLQRGPESALIVGAGYIGLEMAEALRARGLQVTVVEQMPQVLSTVDPQLAALVAEELGRHDVRVVAGTTVTGVVREGGRLKVTGHPTDRAEDNGSFSHVTDVVLVVVGVRPDTALAQTAGVRLGVREAIAVDRRMRTGVPAVYAAGDCVHTYHRLLDTEVYLPLGSTAHKQGRVAGENAAGGDRQFVGSLATQAVKVFDLVAARTGLRDADAREHGFTPVTRLTRADDHKGRLYTVEYTYGRDAREAEFQPIRRWIVAAAAYAHPMVRRLAEQAAVRRRVKSVSAEGQSVTYDDGPPVAAAPTAGMPATSTMDRWRLAGRRAYTRPGWTIPRPYWGVPHAACVI